MYGIIHDQITYTISPEYYTKFKFIQFGIAEWGMGENIGTEKAPEIILRNPKFGVSIVGFFATWWVGLFIGFILGLLGLIHRDAKTMFKETIKSFVITIIITFLTGFIGLIYGKFTLALNPPRWRFPENLIDQSNFIAVGSMHNYSYLGGLIGLVGGIVFTIWRKRKIK
jgi:hypothetical protein